jgi:hypothetical protein
MSGREHLVTGDRISNRLLNRGARLMIVGFVALAEAAGLQLVPRPV